MPRLLIVSNRLPVNVRADHEGLRLARSSGGLAAAVRGPHERLDSRWIGWPGDVDSFSPEHRRQVDAELARMRTVPVFLGAAEQHRFYDGFSNGVLWPLFHYLLDKVNLDAELDWRAYQRVNERFADVVAEQYEPGDAIWVHDDQLHAPPGAAPGPPPAGAYRLLPPCPVPVRRGLPHSPVARADPSRSARRRPARLPYRRVSPAFLGSGRARAQPRAGRGRCRA
jgi:hypothetical protein